MGPNLKRQIIEILQDILNTQNVYISTFKTTLEHAPPNLSNLKIIIKADHKPANEHSGRYNAPTTNEIAVLMLDEDKGPRDIVLHGRDGRLQRVSELHRSYDPLQYPLMFICGEDGYCIGIPTIFPATGQINLNKTVSCMQFYSYRFMVRDNETNFLLLFRKLFSQFVVDMAAKMISARLNFIRTHQKTLRAENYIHLRDAVNNDANVNPRNVGQQIILPSTFTGSPRYLHEKNQDAMTYVRKHGRPDLFITMTCKPEWQDIKTELFSRQKSVDRHDIVARDDGYPQYRRRSLEKGGEVAVIGTKEINNSWVVPYSPILSRCFSAHINVEYCHSVKAIKYLTKYINKGSDQATFAIKDPKNEVEKYLNGRYLSTSEAFWRIFKFPIHDHYPAVYHLAVHLENGQRVTFNDSNFQQISQNPPATTLTEFFKLCRNDNFAKTLLYCDVPSYYTWKNKQFYRRKQGKVVPEYPGIKRDDTLGRVYTIHPNSGECFFLRILLHNVRGPVSFKMIRTVNGEIQPTYQAACKKLGLLEDDEHWKYALVDASATQSPRQIRDLFAILLMFCQPTEPKSLWEEFKESMCEDILYQARSEQRNNELLFSDDIFNQGLILIEDKLLMLSDKRIDEYGLPKPTRINQMD
ncbi:uncharacterized protein LOC129943200 [Eupeodes corollae]|uniref:uncharacterized protein LOC129943200 n=1 Tax=Eupeodes corollae TaxID=290404 RepID=UPI002490FED4|nr:uncharacterized protein LOC129943200 [Eupeodes corollae]